MLRSFFTPRRIGRHVFVLGVVAAFVWAGRWQWSRLQWQNAYVARVLHRLSLAPVPLSQLLPQGAAIDPDGVTYRRVTVTGTFDAAREIVVGARSLRGVNGNDVLSPLRDSSGRAVLVNRGWVPFGLDRPPIVQAAPPSGPVTVSGVLFPSEVRATGGPPSGPAVTRIDLYAIGRRLPYPTLPVYLWMQDQRPAQAAALPRPVPLPDLTAGPPHLSYTIQWFSFAAIGVVGYGLFLAREARRIRGAVPRSVGGTASA